MKTVRLLLCGLALFFTQALCGVLAAAENADGTQAVPSADQAALNTTAAAAVATGKVQPEVPAQDFLEHIVDMSLQAFNVSTSGNTTIHYVISALFLVVAFFLRHLVTKIFFGILKKFAARTETTLDDKLFPALEGPAAAFISVTGLFAALKVLKLTPEADLAVGLGSTVAFSLVIFWGLLRAFNAILDHVHEVATEKQMSIAAFMPWIKKSLVVIFAVFGVLMIVQNLGVDVKALLAGLGLGGLAFALAAQDTLANIFGSVVVAIDQPFKIGETVRIGAEVGTVEDIGLRSTKIRKLDRSLLVIPNKSVAGENIANLSRFNGRRVEQVLGLTYNSTAAQMDELVAEVRRLLLAENEIDPDSVIVYFRDFNSSSLDIWIVFNVKDPDFHKHMVLRQRLNLAYMREVEARGLSFAFPTQTVVLEGPVAKQLAAKK